MKSRTLAIGLTTFTVVGTLSITNIQQVNSESVDRTYLRMVDSTLRDNGNRLTYYLSSSEKVKVGHYLCYRLDSGDSIKTFGKELFRPTPQMDENTVHDLGFLLGVLQFNAVHAYCPQYVPALEQYVNELQSRF